MKVLRPFVCAIFSIILTCHLSHGQLPPRLNIPGALLLPQGRPGGGGFRQARIQSDSGPPQRLRRPIPNAVPVPVSIRPVVEEAEEPPSSSSNFDDEVSRLGISALQSAVRQAAVPEEDEPPRAVQFRPERPLPVLRQDIRDNVGPSPRPLPVLRQEQRENIPRPIPRQELREENIPLPRPQPTRHVQPRPQIPLQPPPQQAFRQQTRVPQPARQPSQFIDDEERPHGSNSRGRKPPVQILRKYRTDNPDGSITWGYENEDGTFKEETLGIDCVTKGKYGYIDPDGVRRDYSYETGNKCDQRATEEEAAEEELILQNRQPQPQARKPQPQFRPQPAQY